MSQTSSSPLSETSPSHDSVYDRAPEASPPLPSRGDQSRAKFRRANVAEIELDRNLRQLENDDLSIHLYDAHVLKRQTVKREFDGDVSNLTQRKGKRRLLDDKYWTQDDDTYWLPRQKWTAWPLKLAELPLESEHWGVERSLSVENERVVEEENAKPSDELEAQLVAEALRYANRCLSTAQNRAESVANYASTAEQSSVLNSSSGSNVSHARTTPNNISLEASSDVESLVETSNTDGLQPSIALDDEQTAATLRPDTQRISRQLDQLLKAMRRSRENHVRGKRSKFKGGNSHFEPRMTQGSIEVSAEVQKESRQASARRYTRRKPYQQDWSEVLGTALHVGWNPDVVEAARRRCQSLLGESMLTTILHESAVETNVKAETHEEGEDTVMQSIEVVQEPHGRLPTTALTYGWKCPEQSCNSDQQVFPARQQWLHHIKEAHGYEYCGLETIVPLNSASDRQSALCCPDSHCERHQWPYDKRRRLAEHMKRKHGQRIVRNSSAAASSQAGSDTEAQIAEYSSSEDEMYGGVHIDGFLKPVKSRLGWRGPSRSRSGSQARSRSAQQSDSS